MKIALASDHAGFEYKLKIREHIELQGIEVEDFGAFSKQSVDYPDYIHPAAESVVNEQCSKGIILCGSGNGAAITANKHKKIRCAIAWNTELAQLARQHNDANMLSIPSRFVSIKEAIEITDEFLKTNFEGGRHQTRINKI